MLSPIHQSKHTITFLLTYNHGPDISPSQTSAFSHQTQYLQGLASEDIVGFPYNTEFCLRRRDEAVDTLHPLLTLGMPLRVDSCRLTTCPTYESTDSVSSLVLQT